ncbi:MAG TPA: sulfotransferase [Caulobacteraceae bacterium]
MEQAESRPNPRGEVAKAHGAMEREAWPEALAAWDEVLARFPRRPNAPLWRSRRAAVLLRLGRAEEAEAAARELLEGDQQLEAASLVLIRALIQTGRPEEALAALADGPLRAAHTAAVMELRLDALIRLGRQDEARAEFEQVFEAAANPVLLAVLFAVVPPLYENQKRIAMWVSLLRKVQPLVDGENAGWREPAVALRARLHLALRNRGAFLATMKRADDDKPLGFHDRRLRAVAAALGDAAYPDLGRPRIFGIGLSQTGGASLAAALDMLGFNTLDWRNPLTLELLSEADFYAFDAFTGTTACVGFEKSFFTFPNSRFIYTTRPLEAWREAIANHWRKLYGSADFDELKAALAGPERFLYSLAQRDIAHALYLNHPGFSEAYQAYDKRVRRFFEDKPADRFLELDVLGGAGWPDLCRFLGKSEPDEPFPRGEN